MRRAGGHCSFFLRGAESERESSSERPSGEGRHRGAGEAAQPSLARCRAATMLNNLTDCEDGDGGANPGKQWSGGGGGGGGGGGQIRHEKQSGGPSPGKESLGLTQAVGAEGCMEACSIGMR